MKNININCNLCGKIIVVNCKNISCSNCQWNDGCIPHEIACVCHSSSVELSLYTQIIQLKMERDTLIVELGKFKLNKQTFYKDESVKQWKNYYIKQ